MSRSVLFATVSIILFSLLTWPALASEPPFPPLPLQAIPLNSLTQITPTTAFTSHFPLITRAKPTNSMARLVLQPDEVPFGFILNDDGVITDFTKIQQFNPVEGYQTSFMNFGQLFTGPFLIANTAYLLETSQDAQGYFQFVYQNLARQPNATQLPHPLLGEETLAYQIITTTEFLPAVMITIVFRKRNIVAVVAIVGIYPMAADYNLTISLAQIIARKF